MTQPVLHSFAREANGQLVDIMEYQRKVHSCVCIQCHNPMVGKQGVEKRWHFAHKNSACSGEGALHLAAKELIKEGLEKSRAEGKEYIARWHCDGCETTRSFNLTAFVRSVQLEKTGIPGVRSDVWIEGEKSPFAIEVVVESPISDDAASAYLEHKIAVFVVRPTWARLRSLKRSLDAVESLNLKSTNCTQCKALARERAATVDAVDSLRRALPDAPNSDSAIPSSWLDGLPGERAKLRMIAKGEMLFRFGFHTGKSDWAFSYVIPNGLGTAYVHLTDSGLSSPVTVHWYLNAAEPERRPLIDTVVAYWGAMRRSTDAAIFDFRIGAVRP